MGRPKGSKNKVGNGVVPLRVNTVSGEELRAYIDRIERVNEEIAEWTSDRRAIYAEVKGAGYDTATVRAIVKRRAVDPEKRATADDLLAEYMSALGDFASTPLGEAGVDRVRGEGVASANVSRKICAQAAE
jgi:uncharacterized protein (UPF0335 family)